MIEISLSPRKISLYFLATVLFLTFIHCIVQVLFFNLDNPAVFFLTRWFDLDIEYNLPSAYSAFAIWICSLLLLFIALKEHKRFEYQNLCWFGLSFIFFYLSLDEFFQLHENIGDIVERYVDATGFFYFPWIIPYGFSLIFLMLLYLNFFLNLPRKNAFLFFVAGVIYLSGAIGFDMLGGREAEVNGYDSIMYCIYYTIEELLEMIAVVLMIYALLSYIQEQFGKFCITIQIRCDK